MYPPVNDKYCPNDFVTRGEMAAFMNRLGAVAPGKTPVVNADKLDGLDSTDFMTILAHSYGSFLDATELNLGPATDTQIADSVDITVPAAGVLLIHNTSSWDVTGTDYVVHSWVELDSTPGCDPNYFGGDPIPGSFGTDAEESSAGRANTAAVSTVAVSGAGTYTVLHCLQNDSGTGINGLDHALSVQWFPAAFSTYATAQASPSSPATPPAGSTSSGG